MRLEGVATRANGFESAARRAETFLASRRYRSPERVAESVVLRRGSLLGSVIGLSPRRWKARLSVSPLAPSRVHVVVEADDRFQSVTQGERAFWAREVAGVLAAIESRGPSPAVPAQTRAAFMSRATVSTLTHALGGAAGGAIVGGVAWALLHRLLPALGIHVPSGLVPEWAWPGSGAVLFGAEALREGGVVPLDEFVSRAVGGPAAEGEAWTGRSPTGAGDAYGIEGLVVVLNRDFPGKMEFVTELLARWVLPAAPVRVVVHPRAAERELAEGVALRQMLVAGVAVDRSRFNHTAVHATQGVAGSIISQWRRPSDAAAGMGSADAVAGQSGTPRPATVERFDAGLKTLQKVIGGAMVMAGLLPLGEGLARGRALAATDTAHTLHLVVERKAELGDHDVLGGLHVHGRIAETDERAHVAVFRADFETAAAGQRLEVYRTRPGESVFVFRRKYDESWPVTRLPGVAFSWHFFLGATLMTLGLWIACARLPAVPARDR